MKNDIYRHMLNELTRKTFGFDFENWVTQGYFEGDYIPYSFLSDGKVISNVSANIMKFNQNGTEKKYIQIGTVMTDEAFRKQGLAGKLIEHVLDEYKDQCDGIYLFGNLDAIGFYEKMNFKSENQYRYFVKEEYCNFLSDDEENGVNCFKLIKNMNDEIKNRYFELVRNNVCNSSLEQINKYGLQMFYTAGLDDVFYAKDIDCFIVLEQGENLELKSIISNSIIPLEEILRRIKSDKNKCILGFTPKDEDKDKCICEEYDGADDYRLFYMGEELEAIHKEKMYFPDLSHA